ncbi:MAG: glucose-1-phosphate adenylyltransferase subunit GlgD [Oscillospiraceae bacterium]|nr:glucose-1-phosphate adenylyltransferase subunit GlgD [Oscillospiraceae bacterium]
MLNHKTLGIIFANMHDAAVNDLTQLRSMASLPFGGRYRMIDFYLSSLVEAGVSQVGIVTKSNYQSLMDHIGSGRDWDLARRGGISILPPYSFSNANGNAAYHGRIEALYNVLGYLKKTGAEYVVLMDADHVCTLDIEALVEGHHASGADVTMVVRKPDGDLEGLANCVAVRTDETGRVREMLQNNCKEGFKLSMNVFVVSRAKLVEMIEDATSRMHTFFERDVLQANLDTLDVRVSFHTGYVRRITSLQSYYENNLDLINPANIDALFRERTVFTKVHDSPPVRYGLECKVGGAVIADGCVIEGTVENCVLFRGVHVKKGAVVRNCILMQDTVVGENSVLDSVITDKEVTVSTDTKLSGAASYPLYIKKGSEV